MRRVTMLLAAMGVMVTLFAAAAYAAEIVGTNQNDDLFESDRNDTMYGRDGEDTILATEFSTETIPQGDRDDLFGNRHSDTLNAQDGDTRDSVDGGEGYDFCLVDDMEGGADDWEDCEVVNGTVIP
jgi:hypothetical protein